MSLTERHRWCAKKILEAFSPEVDMEVVQTFIRSDSNVQRFSAFFRGEGPGRLFVYFQSPAPEGDVSLHYSIYWFHHM
jgi:hypothetical protein